MDNLNILRNNLNTVQIIEEYLNELNIYHVAHAIKDLNKIKFKSEDLDSDPLINKVETIENLLSEVYATIEENAQKLELRELQKCTGNIEYKKALIKNGHKELKYLNQDLIKKDSDYIQDAWLTSEYVCYKILDNKYLQIYEYQDGAFYHQITFNITKNKKYKLITCSVINY